MATDDLTSSPITTDPTPTSGLTISTDQPDYAPGSTATFTVSGASANDTLDFVVVDTAGNPVSGTNAPWTVTADLSGTTTTTWSVGQDAAGEAFTVQVLDETTGQVATAAFTDSNPHTNTNTPTEPPLPSGVHDIDLATHAGRFRRCGSAQRHRDLDQCRRHRRHGLRLRQRRSLCARQPDLRLVG